MKKNKIVALISTVVLLCGASLYIARITAKFNYNQSTVYQDKVIKDVYTDKSAYKPNEKVNYSVELKNDTGKDYFGTLKVNFKHLNQSIEMKTIKMDLKKGEAKKLNLEWVTPKSDYTGYFLEVYAQQENKLMDHRNTAVDVASDWSKFPRYGYLANFPKMDKREAEKIIDNLSKFHLNGVQFYDWQYKHDEPLAGTVDNPNKTWPDIANRITSGETIKNYISLLHDKNMMAANYNLMFGAYEDYSTRGVKKEWGLYKDTEHLEPDSFSLPSSWAINNVNLMNPANKDWQKYIFQKEDDAMKVYNFDVFHVDTLGSRGTLYDYDGNEVKLDGTYKEFMNNAKKALNKKIIINTVQEFGKIPVAKGADVDFLYTEIWPPSYTPYSAIKKTIDNDFELSNSKKASVLAGYLNYGLQVGDKFNENSVKLADASIFAAGGAHIELGDTGMLANEYFPNNNVKMTPSLVSSMRKYYDFLVGYENILRDNMKGVDTKIEIPSVKVSDDGSTNSIWAYSKENDKYQTVQLINLLNRDEDSWRDDNGTCKAPEVKKDFMLKLYISNTKIKGISIASPDLNEGSSKKLKFSKRKDSKGTYLEIKVPELQYWDMIFIEK